MGQNIVDASFKNQGCVGLDGKWALRGLPVAKIQQSCFEGSLEESIV